MRLQRTLVDPQSAGMRLDLFVTRSVPESSHGGALSRSGVQKLIAEGQITVNGKRTKAGVRLRINDRVIIQALPSIPSDLLAEPIALNVI
jgi:23S rRNA pseudouridine1911/1915/1917 synthase